ncbi:beta-lactamase superfamily domain-containing protein [Chaetomium fimeti]|uniref:Beta-lactamase superfamily domain-containing protein n=1 Tax=Chaetomium fimeti TaxID=1854472 RepID=A0AAE0LMX5_9PEZI|nr:beta-lactamase superfamily domain-containing protein [Chaetomium fimeti]
MLAISNITTSNSTVEPPEHHVIPVNPALAPSGWASYLPSWGPSPGRTRPSVTNGKIAGFRNPWPSWHRPTLAEKYASFQWGEDNDGCAELAASHLTNSPALDRPPHKSKLPNFVDPKGWPNSLGAKAARLLRIEGPDFSFPEGSKAKATWLGHAGVLVQLPSLDPQNGRPVRCVFDPIFSDRCSPLGSFAGPIRSYPPPCKAEDLPAIDVVCISHNHFDHMDQTSLMSIWRHSRNSVRFFVPLGNKRLLLEWGIPDDRITEMDWWDSVQLTLPSTPRSPDNARTLTIHCTPAQHNSFRGTNDANTTLWSSWLLESHTPHHQTTTDTTTTTTPTPYRVFFAGDTGYQFHPSPHWPPSPANPTPQPPSDSDSEFPPCPAFAQIRARLGPPNLLLLPVSVGATFAYLRSFVPLPDWLSPFPRHSAGVTGANHMPPWDAVRVVRVMAGMEAEAGGDGDGEEGRGEDGERGDGVVALAMHWGTFVPDPADVLRTLGALEWACTQQGVKFSRGLGEGRSVDGDASGAVLGKGRPVFVAVNHGGSVCL